MRNLNRFAPPALVALCLCLLAGPIAAAEKAPAAPAPAQRKIKAVVLTGGHGYDKKAFPKPFEGHADIACEFTAPQKGKPGLFADVDKWAYDTIVLYNFRQKLSKAEQANFLKLLDRGVGLFILHHALAAYPDWKEYEKILGARYYLKPTEVNGVKHPRSIWKHDVDMKIHVADAGHAITKGMKDFVIHDETYGKWSYFPAGGCC